MRSKGIFNKRMKRRWLKAVPNQLKKKRIIRALRNGPRLPLDNIKAARAELSKMNLKKPEVKFQGRIANEIAVTNKRDTPVRIYTPEGPGPFPLIIYLHGGGFSLGDLDMVENVCRILADSSQHVVISVDYALAPEYKYPFALEESKEVFAWIEHNAGALNLHMDGVVIAGDSAGGNLAASLSMKLIEEEKIIPRYQVLICPVVDMQTRAEVKLEGMEELVLSASGMRTFHQNYLNTNAEAADPFVSPLFAPLETFEKMPATILITEQNDPLAKEALKYAEKLKQAGVKVTHKHYDGLFHDFVAFAGVIDEAEEALTFIGEKLRGK